MKHAIIAVVAALASTGCYGEDLLDGTVDVFVTGDECVGTELVDGWGVGWPRGEDQLSWRVSARCDVRPSPDVVGGASRFDFQFRTNQTRRRFFDSVEPGAWKTADPWSVHAQFWPELPEGHPCLAEASLRLRQDDGPEDWETVTLDYDGPCATALLTITNN